MACVLTHAVHAVQIKQMGNKGAFIRFKGHDMVPHFTKFDAVPHPGVRPMAYATSFLNSGIFGF